MAKSIRIKLTPAQAEAMARHMDMEIPGEVPYRTAVAPPAITATLHILSSRQDSYGNRYWAFRFVDHATGREVHATISGGESNIDAIRRHWGTPDGWDRSIQTVRQELPIREYNRLIKGWDYAGCNPADLAAFIRVRIGGPPAPSDE